MLLLNTSPGFAQRGASTTPADLDQIVKQAQTIVRGHVVSATFQPLPQFPNLATVLVTMKVDRVLKGNAGSVLVFRQFVWDTLDSSVSTGYNKSEELLLFLNPASEYGLTSPVGLEQGRFRILRDSKGKLSAVNGRGNLGLFDQVNAKVRERGLVISAAASAILAAPRGPVPLDALEDLVQTLVGGQK